MLSVGMLALAALLPAGCAGHQLTRGEARNILTNFPGLKLAKETIYVEHVSQLDSSHAVAEADLKTAFKLEKMGEQWTVTEIRVDQGQWIRIDELYGRLLENQIQRTRQDMNLIALGLERYRIYNARYADADNVTQLMEMLYPRFVFKMIVEDAWARPMQYRLESATRYTIISAGPDGRFATDDDIVLTAGKDFS